MAKKNEFVDIAFLSEPIEVDDDPFESKFGGAPVCYLTILTDFQHSNLFIRPPI
jgi:hypothetical protein